MVETYAVTIIKLFSNCHSHEWCIFANRQVAPLNTNISHHAHYVLTDNRQWMDEQQTDSWTDMMPPLHTVSKA